MTKTKHLEYLIESNRWFNYCEQIANAFNVNIFSVSDNYLIKAVGPKDCPACTEISSVLTKKISYNLSNISRGEIQELTLEDGSFAFSFLLHGTVSIMIRKCSLCNSYLDKLELQELSETIQQLLLSYKDCLLESIEGGQKSVELSVIKQLNSVVMDIFKREKNAVENSLKIVLSTLVVLLDAKGSWLKINNREQNLITTGDIALINKSLQKNTNNIVINFQNDYISYSLSVVEPENEEQAKSLLNLMAYECTLIFEIEHLLKLAQVQFTRVLNSIGSAVFLINKTGTIIYTNKSATELFGRPINYFIGHKVAEFPVPWISYIDNKNENFVKEYMTPIDLKTETKWIDWQIAPLKEGESFSGWLVIADDKTDYFKWQKAVNQAERLNSTAKMVSALAHELRNPLSASKGLIELMGRKQDSASNGYYNLLLQEIDRVIQLLNEFLLLGKPADIEIKPLDLKKFFEELQLLFKSMSLNNEVNLVVNLEQVPLVRADAGQLKQAILNILNNAMEAVAQKGEVELNLEKSNEGIIISVKDNGPGFGSEVLENMFNPFFTTKERGTGLGLPLAKVVVDNHGWQIEASNNPEGGALFKIIIPPHAQHVKGVNKIDVIICTVDQHAGFLSEQALRQAGFSVVLAASIEEALQMSDDVAPHLFIMEQLVCNEIVVEKINTIWPQARLLLLGQSDFHCTKKLEFICTPTDNIHLISKVKTILHDTD